MNRSSRLLKAGMYGSGFLVGRLLILRDRENGGGLSPNSMVSPSYDPADPAKVAVHGTQF